MTKYATFFLLLLLISCNNSSNLSPSQLKVGTFKTKLLHGDTVSFATRNDSIQIETYQQQKDTFYIHWISNFEYSLTKKNPKTELDKTAFIVKITGINSDGYSFTAHFKGSNFKQKGNSERISTENE